MSEELLTEKQVAELMALSPMTLAKARLTKSGAGAIPYCKIGRAVRYRRSDVDAYIERALRTSTSGAGEY